MSGRRRVHRILIGVALVAAGVFVPARLAWSEPAVRLDRVPVTSGQAVTLAHPSSHLAVRWTGQAGVDGLELRWRSTGGPWQAWQPVEIDDDSSRGTQLASTLTVAHDANEAEIRVVAGAPVGLQLVAIDTEHGARHLVTQRVNAASADTAPEPGHVEQPSVVTRAEWGADESLRTGTPEYAPITRIAVHHTATTNDDTDPAATVRAIYAYHTQSNGWNDIGYNFLIDASGRIYEGRWARDYAAGEIPTGEDLDGNGIVGAHVLSNNVGTVGIALLGTFTDQAPSDAAVASLERLIAWKADRHHIDPLASTMWSTGEHPTIIGHRDAGTTECPGQQLYDRLPLVRQTVANILATTGATRSVTGYWVLGRDASLYAFGASQPLSPAGGQAPPTPVESVAPTPTGFGLWVLSANGRITPYGDAEVFGSTEGMKLNARAVRLEPTRSGRGYWVLAADGGIFAFGDAGFFGSTGNLVLNKPIISMSATPSGQGYWLLASDGGVFTFGDGGFFGSTGSMRLNAPVVSMAAHPSGGGYWLQAADGGIFSFGDVHYYGSVPGLQLPWAAKTVQIRVTPSGNGYYVMGADGGIFTFGDAMFYDAHPGLSGTASAIDLALRTD